MENIVKKADERLYVLYQLKCEGITQKHLSTVYFSVVRPAFEYACPIWYTNSPQ